MSDQLLRNLVRDSAAPIPQSDAAPIDAKGVGLPTLARFVQWNASTWALDEISRRLTGGSRDWQALRAALIAGSGERLMQISLDDRFTLWEAVSSQHDPQGEAAVARWILCDPLVAEGLAAERLARVIAGLLRLDCVDDVRSAIPLLPPESWERRILELEVQHPRFGGSYQDMLRRLNAIYREADMSPVALDGETEAPFLQLSGVSGPVERGPLTTVVMSAWRPGEVIFTAIRSIINQTYQDWELIVTDDASGAEYDEVFARIARLDPRVRVIRNDVNAGTYVRRNEVLRDTSGAFVTFQDSDDWSHPSRLAVQVRDLLAHPQRVGNIVRHARVTQDLSFATNRGIALGPGEPTIMFRRGLALGVAGYYDAVRKAADREYRLRLEVATGERVETVGPEVPLQLMLADPGSLSGADFAPGWMTPARVAYRNASDRYRSLIVAGGATARVECPQITRHIVAPPEFLGVTTDNPEVVDVLVILDGRERRGREAFLQQVAREIQQATHSGMTVGLLHSDSLGGRLGGPRLSEDLQALVDTHRVKQVFDDRSVNAGLVVVRHACAAQGHDAVRRNVVADRVVIVEDPSGGDVRGRTISVSDVVTTVAAWVDAAPEWLPPESITVRQELDRRNDAGRVNVVATVGAPAARTKYADHLFAFETEDLSIRHQRGAERIERADVVYGVEGMESALGVSPTSTPEERLSRTRRFVNHLRETRTGLVRTVYGEAPAHEHPLAQEARRLLDAATDRFIVVDGVTEAPDPARTVVIPFPEPSGIFQGYPTREPVTGRVLVVVQESSSALAKAALRCFFVTRASKLTLRIVGSDTDQLIPELKLAISRSPGRVTSRAARLADAALIEEISAAELVLVPSLETLGDYQTAMIALALGRPVGVPSNPHAVALAEGVGEGWLIPLATPLTGFGLDHAVARARSLPRGSSPDLSGRDRRYISHRVAEVLLNVAYGGRNSEPVSGAHDTADGASSPFTDRSEHTA